VRSLGGRPYSEIVEEVRRGNERFAEENPGTALTANLAGGLVPFVGPLGRATRLADAARWAGSGRTLPRTMLRSATFGGGLGTVAGLGAGEGDLAERLPGAMTGQLLGTGIGAAIPPIAAGAGRLVRAMTPVARRLMPRRATEPAPVQPAGTPEPVVGMPISGAQFVDERTAPALNDQAGALRMISDWITRSGGSADDIAGAWTALQEAQRRFHGTGRVINAQTLVELYPPLQRLLRAGASGFTEVGEDVTRFLTARQTGVLPRGASATDLARRGVPTRGRFLPEMTGAEAERALGTRFGVPAGSIVPAGALARVTDFGERMLQVKDYKYHGHAITASSTSDEILTAMRAASTPAYNAARAADPGTVVRSAIEAIASRWRKSAEGQGKDYRAMIGNALDRFSAEDGNMVTSLQAFDNAKQKLDDVIGGLMRAGERYEAGVLTELKNEMLAAVDGIKANNLGPLYAEARGIFAGGSRQRDILEQFKTAHKDAPGDVVRRYDALLDNDERKLAEKALMGGIEAVNAGRRVGLDVTTTFDTPNAMRVIAAIGRRQRTSRGDAEDVMRSFGRLVEGEQEMVRGTARTAIGGSMTDRNIQDALSMGVMEIAQNVQSWSNIWRGSQSLFEVGQRVTTAILDRAFGLSADRARELSRMLLTANPDEITAIIARLQAIHPPSRMTRFNELMQQVQRGMAPGVSGLSGGAAGAPTPQPSPGPVNL
jgi:hypothetical protein